MKDHVYSPPISHAMGVDPEVGGVGTFDDETECELSLSESESFHWSEQTISPSDQSALLGACPDNEGGKCGQ